jgi:hypothetical protein
MQEEPRRKKVAGLAMCQNAVTEEAKQVGHGKGQYSTSLERTVVADEAMVKQAGHGKGQYPINKPCPIKVVGVVWQLAHTRTEADGGCGTADGAQSLVAVLVSMSWQSPHRSA